MLIAIALTYQNVRAVDICALETKNPIIKLNIRTKSLTLDY